MPLLTHRYVLSTTTARNAWHCLAHRKCSFPFHQAAEAFKTTKAGVGPDGKMAIKCISKFAK
jgi:hypothetical protein